VDERGSHKLKDLAETHIDPRAKDTQKTLEKWMKDHNVTDFSKVPLRIIAPYAEKDTFYTYKLWEYLKPMIEKDYKELAETEHKLLWTTIKMEKRGVLIDVEHLKAQSKSLLESANKIEKEIQKILDASSYKEEITLSSNESVSGFLISQGIEVGKSTKTGKPVMDKWFLQKVDHPIAKLIMDWRALTHVEATYCKGLPERAQDIEKGKGTIYCNFKQTGTVTGRFSCTDPNLQNIPREAGGIRKGFLVREGYRNFYFDYSQVEMRILAHYSRAPEMLEAYKNNIDLHSLTASKLRNKPIKELTEKERYDGKHLNFAIIYGMGATGFAKKFEVSVEVAKEFLNNYFDAFPMIRAFKNLAWRKVSDTGKLRNLYGRVRHLKYDEGYKAVNALIQSAAADLLKKAMVRVDDILKKTKSHIIMQIHDELVIEIFKGEEYLISKIQKTLSDCPEYRIPIVVDVQYSDTNWEEKKDWEGK